MAHVPWKTVLSRDFNPKHLIHFHLFPATFDFELVEAQPRLQSCLHSFRPLLVTKRNHRIDVGGAAGRQIGSERGYADHQADREENRHGIIWGDTEKQA
jgi:hypothetical protein